MPEISVQTAGGAKTRYPLSKDQLTIGRSRDNDIFLPDQWLSRRHAAIQQRPDGVYLVDLGSKNGTLLNGARIQSEQRLRGGDVINLGEHLLVFDSGEPHEEPEAPLEPGTRIFSVRELSEVASKPAVDARDVARQSRFLALLKAAAASLMEHRPLPETLRAVLDLIFEAVPAERAAILLLEGTPAEPVVKASRSRRGDPITSVSRSIARKVMNDRVAAWLPNLMEDAAFRAQDSILSTGIRSAICAPLWYTPSSSEPDQVIGLVYLDTRDLNHRFTEEDVEILTALANVAAAKIENVRLLEDRMEKRLLDQDMAVAAEIQRGLLPRSAPSVPGYGLSGSNKPCRTIGGDYYDFGIHEGHLLMALGDVSGKGTGAALLMTVLRAAVRGHWTVPSTAEAMSRINSTVCQNVPENKYITFFMARLDPASGTVRYVNAGHNPPLLVRSTGELEMLQTGGMVLGLFDAVPYEEGVAVLQPGDVLLIFSDGVTETWSPTGEEFAEDRLVDVARARRGLEASKLEEAILEALDRFSGGAKITDDRTLIVLKRY